MSNTNSMNWIKKMRLSTPAYIALIAYIILSLTIILPFEYPMTNENNETVIIKYDVGQRLICLILMAVPIGLSIYSINCMMVGKCEVLSYVTSLISVLWVAIFVIVAFMTTFSNTV
jgi:hypothetical protein